MGSSETAYGKTVSELQSNVVVEGDAISGTLHYVTGYTGFDGSDPLEQEGNYLALTFTPTSWDGVMTVELVGGTKGAVTLSEGDDFCVFKVDNIAQTIKSYSLTSLVLESDE